MSHNQSRVEKSDGQLRKSGGRSGLNRGFSGSGGGGKSGGGGSGAAPPHQLSSSSNHPSLSSNRSYKKSGNGQGGQSRINPASPGSETSATTATSRALQNGAPGQHLSHGSPTTPTPSGPKSGDAPLPRTSRALPKAPSSQYAAGISDSATPSTPVKGDGAKPFALQFGTISPGIVNGLQIPARTSSAPPNLDEQKRDQARHDSFRAVPTQPIPSGPKQQMQSARKDVVGVNQSTSGESLPPSQVKREAHQQIPTASVAPPPKSAPLPIPGISMAMPFQQAPIPMQFGGPGPQQMPMTLSIGNPPQVPQQMFVHNLQSHPLQPQAMIHQGQGLGFGPQISHQLGQQLGNLGMGIAAPQFAQQQQQQQPGKFGGPRKTTTVKITHPETHEELRLDKRTGSYTDGGLSGQRPPSNSTPQSQPIASFTPQHYFPQLQPNSYNPSPIFFPTSTSVTTASQPPRFGYPVRQSGQAISLINPSLMNSMSGSKSQPPLLGPSEPVKSEPSLISTPLVPTQGSVKPTSVPIGPKVEGPTVTISMPISKAEEPKLLNPPREATLVHQQRHNEVSTESSFPQPETFTQSPGINPLSASGGHTAAVTSVVSTERASPGTSSASAIPSKDFRSVAVATEGKKKEPVRRSDSLKDHQKKSSKKDLSPFQQQQQTDESASVTTTKFSSVKNSKDGSAEDVNDMQLTEVTHESSRADISTTTTSLASSGPENGVSTEAKTGEAVEDKAVPIMSGSSGVAMKEAAPGGVPTGYSDSLLVASSDGIPIKEKDPLNVSSSCGPEIVENIARDLHSAACQTDNASPMVECIKKMPEESRHEKSEVSEVSMLDTSNAKVHPVPTTAETSEDVKPVLLVKQEEGGANNLEKLIDCGTRYSERQLISSDVERKLDVKDVQAPTSSEPKKAASNDKDMPSSPHPIKSELETTCSHDICSTVPGVSPHEAVAAEAPVTSERTNKSGAYVMEVPKDGPTPSIASGPKGALESTKVKLITGRKKKRKEILSKADAAGSSDLYNAYKGPEEKNQVVTTSESLDSSLTVDGKHVNADNPDKDVVAIDEDDQSKAELDDWEDAADDSTPKLENGKEVNEANKHPDDDGSEATGTKKYTRDFLLTLSEQCTDLPVCFEIGSDIADALMSGPLGSSHVVERDPYPSPGRITDRSPGVSRGDRRGISTMNDARWSKTPNPLHDIRMDVGQNFRPGQGVNHGVLRNPRGQPSNQFVPILSGPMQSLAAQGGLMRNNSDADRWRSLNNARGLMPPPPMQVMHKAERKYEIGKVSDEEQGKQRQLKAILNKLTPQNFEKLFQQVKEVNIDNTVTLSGVISQIFDKALMEPTFCEMYANFCFHLSGELPDFVENDEKITFKRLLLNKCQEEFERGEREQAEANRVEEEGEIKQSDEEREEKRIKARRRMLGNIRLIGELYKKKMLTERIMHECIKKLLGQYQNPDEEDLEALCKLMSTIGDQIDHAKAKEHMDAYFDMMLKLSTNQKLSSRVRFMLRDVIDLRKNRWHQRRKVEGPKKIEEVHRDAAQERQSQTSRLTRGPSMNSASRRGPPVDYGPRGSSVLPSPSSQIGGVRGLPTQIRGYGMQDVRVEDRHPLENRALSLPLTQRPTDDSSITLGPQGGLARGMSIRGQSSISSVAPTEPPLSIGDDHRMISGPNGYSSTSERIPYSSREDVPMATVQPNVQDRNAYVGSRDSRIIDRSFDRFAPATLPAGRTQGFLGGSVSATSEAQPLSEEVLREKSISAIKEFYSAKDEKEVALCIKELNSPSFYPSMVSLWITDSFERKDMERDLLAKLLVNLCKSRDSLLSQVQLTQGFDSVLSSLEDAVNDAPRAAEFLGRIFVKVILENVVPLRDIGKLIHEGGEERGRLLEIGLASEVLGSILEIIKAEKGEPILHEILLSSKLCPEDFKPPHPIKSKKLDAFL